MVVDDPSVVNYATELEITTAPLPHNRTFVLVATGARGTTELLTSEARNDLARAVRTASARPATTPAWWRNELDGCAELAALPRTMISAPAAKSGSSFIYYDAEDEVTRDLAERLVALAAMDTAQSSVARSVLRCLQPKPGTDLRAEGIAREEMDHRLERGDGLAFVVSIPNPVADSCGSGRKLLRRAPWLAEAGGVHSASIVPLIDTRSFVVLANRDVAVTWDIYGNVRIVPPREQP
jgi:hypothetical protein